MTHPTAGQSAADLSWPKLHKAGAPGDPRGARDAETKRSSKRGRHGQYHWIFHGNIDITIDIS
jgi:hypothetical protein